MARQSCLLFAAIVLAVAVVKANAGDPDITTDFLPERGVVAGARFFTFTGLRDTLSGAPQGGAPFKANKASQMEFPALVGQSVSNAVLQFACGGINPPHTHQRSTELLLVIQGTLMVGLVDMNNTLFTQTLYAGDAFVFPKSLVHFQVNTDTSNPAVAVSSFGSSNPGLVSLPKALFGSGIDADVLAKSFNTDDSTVQKLVSANKA